MPTDGFAEFWGEPIHVYTRAEALADGVLVDVTETAKEAGFSVPTAITAAVEADLRDFDAGELVGMSYEGRLWDLLFMARHGAGMPHNRDVSEFVFAMHLPKNAHEGGNYRAKVMIGPGDAGEPVLTILQPHED